MAKGLWDPLDVWKFGIAGKVHTIRYAITGEASFRLSLEAFQLQPPLCIGTLWFLAPAVLDDTSRVQQSRGSPSIGAPRRAWENMQGYHRMHTDQQQLCNLLYAVLGGSAC